MPAPNLHLDDADIEALREEATGGGDVVLPALLVLRLLGDWTTMRDQLLGSESAPC